MEIIELPNSSLKPFDAGDGIRLSPKKPNWRNKLVHLWCSCVASVSIGSACLADATFETGTISIGLDQPSFSDANFINFDSNVALRAGNLGFQLDGSVSYYVQEGFNSVTIPSFGVHVFHQLDNGHKYGAFASYSAYGLRAVGAEALVTLGPVNLEAAIGQLSGSGDPLYTVALNLSYAASENIELNAGYETYFDGNGYSGDFFLLGATFFIPNSSFAVSAEYLGLDGGASSIGANISWHFGRNSSRNLWNERISNYKYF